jgi:hypothetical protein
MFHGSAKAVKSVFNIVKPLKLLVSLEKTSFVAEMSDDSAGNILLDRSGHMSVVDNGMHQCNPLGS